jgi:hypothetical protein
MLCCDCLFYSSLSILLPEDGLIAQLSPVDRWLMHPPAWGRTEASLEFRFCTMDYHIELDLYVITPNWWLLCRRVLLHVT